MSIYLDYNASSPIKEEVLEYMIEIYRNSYGNADSRTHDFGERARKIVEIGRKSVAELMGVNAGEVFFTSGSTESNNIAILGLKDYANRTGKKHIITSTIEHKAVLEAAETMKEEGFNVDFVNPGVDGRVDMNEVLRLVTDKTVLVSIMHVNNETGMIQPVKEIGDVLADKDVLFHIDATQSAGKLVDELKEIKYDMMSFCAHKMYGPQGVGALILKKKRYKLPPIKAITYGGQQEHGLRPGTLPVALIGGFGKACDIAVKEYESNYKKCQIIKDELIRMLDKSELKYKINGCVEEMIANTINICLFGVASEALMLSSKQYCGISNGSACNSTEYKSSSVLTAMGLPENEIRNSLRISWGPEINMEELKTNFGELLRVAKKLV